MTLQPIARNPLRVPSEGVYPVPQIPQQAVVPAQRNGPPYQEAPGAVRNLNRKLAGFYYDHDLQTEFYHPHWRLLEIGWRFKGGEYQSTTRIRARSFRPIAYSAIVLEKFTDQAERIYRRLLKNHPEIPKKPFSGRHRPMYSRFENAFRSPEEIRKELKDREEIQKKTIQKIIEYLREGNDPGIEEILNPTPEELLEKYQWEIQSAALSDAIILVHKKVPPQEQLGPEEHIRLEAAEREAEKVRSETTDRIIREAELREQRTARERSFARKVGKLIEKLYSKMRSLFKCLFCRR